MKLPRGFGWRYSPDDKWLLNHMIHNLLPNRDKVYITYDIDFVPDSSPAAKKIQHGARRCGSTSRAARPTRCSTSTAAAVATGASPTPTTRPARTAAGRRATRRSSRATACWSGRPGTSTRAASTPISSSRAAGARSTCSAREAHYWEPAGAVSWDVAMTATTPKWRVKVKRGDVLSVSRHLRLQARVLVRVDGDRPGGVRARRAAAASTRSRASSTSRGKLTHGHLRENRNHGGEAERPPRPAQAAPPARSPPTRSRSPTSSTARATCCAAAPPRAPAVGRPARA